MNEQSYRKKLWSQLIEAHANVMYTYETQQQAATRRLEEYSCISNAQILLAALSSCGFIAIAFGKSYLAAVTTAALSVVSLSLNLYSRGASLPQKATAHRTTADSLWNLRQDYISLLTDFNNLSIAEIIKKRDSLQSQVHEQYKEAPRTNDRDYKAARKKLKKEETQTFERGECDRLLPVALRGRF